MTRYIHREAKMWVVSVRDADGQVVHQTNVTAYLGWPTYGSVCRVLRAKLGDGQTLDTADADAEHARLVVARERWDAAYQAWYADGSPAGGHPGGLERYLS